MAIMIRPPLPDPHITREMRNATIATGGASACPVEPRRNQRDILRRIDDSLCPKGRAAAASAADELDRSRRGAHAGKPIVRRVFGHAKGLRPYPGRRAAIARGKQSQSKRGASG